MSIILAIDPGTSQSAWVRYDADARRPLDWAKEANEHVLERLFGHKSRVDEVVIERVASYGMSVGQEVFDTCVWIGRFQQAAYFLPVTLMFRREVKLHICSSPRANDASIRQALIDRYGGSRRVAVGLKKAPGPLYRITKDVWQALALAITYAEVTEPLPAQGVTA